jgi:hypothetical protein
MNEEERSCDICGGPIPPGEAMTVESQPGDNDGEACLDCYEALVGEAGR